MEEKEDQIKGGVADKMTVKGLAKKHDVSLKHIKDQLVKGAKVEMEHTDSKAKAIEIAMDHLAEDAEYYDKLETIHVDETEEKEEAKQHCGSGIGNEDSEPEALSESFSKRMKSLAGLEEGESKSLRNESIQDYSQSRLLKESMGDISPEEWEDMTAKGLTRDSKKVNEGEGEEEEFIIHEFEQPDVEPGESDSELYDMKNESLNESDDDELELDFLNEK